MKSIDTKSLTQEQFETLNDLLDTRLVIRDQYGDIAEYNVSDLKQDDNGVIYAPTHAEVQTHTQYGDDVIHGGIYERTLELKGYEPIYTILKQQ